MYMGGMTYEAGFTENYAIRQEAELRNDDSG
jgi:hypothetical protein